MIFFVVWLLLGYALGSIPFGLLLTWAAGLGDIRAIGSGSIGATNVLRTGSKKLAAGTLLLDALKGAVAVLLAGWLAVHLSELNQFAGLWAGLGAVLGHLFPVWLDFRGGKGAATGLGVLIAAAWPVGLLAAAVWIGIAWATRLSSVATLTAVALAPVFAAFLAGPQVAWLALAGAVLIWIRHHANISRLIAGTEPQIGRTG